MPWWSNCTIPVQKNLRALLAPAPIRWLADWPLRHAQRTNWARGGGESCLPLDGPVVYVSKPDAHFSKPAQAIVVAFLARKK